MSKEQHKDNIRQVLEDAQNGLWERHTPRRLAAVLCYYAELAAQDCIEAEVDGADVSDRTVTLKMPEGKMPPVTIGEYAQLWLRCGPANVTAETIRKAKCEVNVCYLIESLSPSGVWIERETCSTEQDARAAFAKWEEWMVTRIAKSLRLVRRITEREIL